MKSSTKSALKSGGWAYQIGQRPMTVTAYERADRGGVVSIRHYVPDRGDYAKKSTGLRIRNPKGKIDPQQVILVQRAVAKIYAQLTQGLVQPSRQPITLADGFVQALTVGSGLYAVDSPSRREMVRLAQDVQDILGARRTLESIRPTDAPTIWRAIATHVAAGRQRTIHNGHSTRKILFGGPRMAERAIDLLFRVARWHYDAGNIATAPQTPRNWRTKLREDWESITKTAPVPANPRHEWGDVKKLHLHRSKADPRIVLLFALAFEARMGQAVRCFRSNLDVTPGAGVLGLGTFVVAGRHKKKGVYVDLSPAQRAAVDDALTNGYLSRLEAEYLAGRIADYALFPSGRLHKGVARVERGTVSLTDDGLASMFRRWETLAGVKHEPGRGWYGLRRIGADRAEDETSDARVLNSITGHRNSTTREGYQNALDPLVRANAAAVREARRRTLSEPDPEPED